jgi:DNA-binding winged helix-turn-helix (wHTH) protein
MPLGFGEFTLDTESRQLRQGDVERHLSPKGFELLRLLLDNRPRALSKAELHERLWPSTFVSEATLSSLVGEVREALGERAGRARFVRTVHRFGYAFKGTATELASQSQPRDGVRCWIIWEGDKSAWARGRICSGVTATLLCGSSRPRFPASTRGFVLQERTQPSRIWGAKTAPICTASAWLDLRR